ncbi:MAG: hypothetical protein QOE25_287, partial [Actinomycetota bacterium]|nr:hypothetical protein [Actinomycetota bacterium]
MDLRRPFAACAALTLIGGGLLLGSVPAAAANPCSATDVRTGTASSDLQAAIDAAAPGDTIQVHGRCIGQFTIAKDLTLVGLGTLDGSHAGRTLTVTAGNVVLSRLTITNGAANGSGSSGYGGDLLVDASVVTLKRTVLSGGEAFGNGGGLFVDRSGEASLYNASSVNGNFADGGIGGGIYSTGRLLVFGSEISGNHAAGGGAGIYSTRLLGVFHSSVLNNG